MQKLAITIINPVYRGIVNDGLNVKEVNSYSMDGETDLIL